MSGGSLYAMLHENGTKMETEMQLRMVTQLAEGVGYLHSKHVIHRDLKSSNVVLDLNMNIKICDFGLTKHMGPLTGNSSGSLNHYMAPELLLENAGKITKKADIWAMGCILVEIFGGALPYSLCLSVEQIVEKMSKLEHPYTDSDGVADFPNMPFEVAEIVEKCFDFDPHTRCSAAQVLECLRTTQ
eukprot:Platyproteum_vivax@DN6974_c0_g1_i1.p2